VVNGLRSGSKENYIPVLLPMITTPGVDFTDVRNWPRIGSMTWSGYQKKKMFRNMSGQAFKEISAEAGVDNDRDGRGIGLGDFDNDGKLDLYQTNADQDSIFYRSVSEGTGNWVQFKLTGTKSNRDAIGARIQLTAGGLTQIREIDGGNGYAGQSMKRAHFGIGAAAKIDAVEIRWPSGLVEKLPPPPVNRLARVTEGKGLVR
jgi:enediyne biosynthesis protein E4